MSKVIDKLIDDIIELILGDMCCYHEQDHDEDGVHTTVEYSLNDETKLRGMIGELIEQSKVLIQKPEVTEEWIEEKARELLELFSLYPYSDNKSLKARTLKTSKDFIHSLVEEIKNT